jgi:hypothetical protein
LCPNPKRTPGGIELLLPILLGDNCGRYPEYRVSTAFECGGKMIMSPLGKVEMSP